MKHRRERRGEEEKILSLPFLFTSPQPKLFKERKVGLGEERQGEGDSFSKEDMEWSGGEKRRDR